MNFFTDENKELHQEDEQKRRQKSALKLRLDFIDRENQSGKIKNYDIYLDSCSCVDFIMRQKPCKHMYRLASDLGIFKLDEKIKIEKLSRSDIEEERKAFKERINQLSESAQRVLQNIVSLHYRIFTDDMKLVIKELKKEKFVVMRKITFLDIAKNFTIKEILEKCVEEKPPKKNKREIVMKFFAENYPDEAKKLTRSIYDKNTIDIDLTDETERNIVVAQRHLAKLLGTVERAEPDFIKYL